MKILVVNAGSSSLKYQLIDMKDESVIAKGNCERIGIDGKITHKTFDGRKYEEECSFPTHTEAFEKLVEVMTKSDAAVISDMSEIAAVGHRIVQDRRAERSRSGTQPRSRIGAESLQEGSSRKHSSGGGIRYRVPPDHAAQGVHVRYALRGL